MADKKISELGALAAIDVATGDRLPIEDVSASTTKSMTVGALRDALGLNGLLRLSFSAVADGAVQNGQGYLIIDTVASPVTFQIKARDSGGNLYTKTIT